MAWRRFYRSPCAKGESSLLSHSEDIDLSEIRCMSGKWRISPKFYIQKIKNFVLHGSWRYVTLSISLYSNDSNPWYPRNHDSAWFSTILTNFNHQESKNLLLFFLYWEITFLRIFNNICKAYTQYFTFDNEICQEPFSTSLLLTTAAIKGSRTRRMRISTVSETLRRGCSVWVIAYNCSLGTGAKSHVHGSSRMYCGPPLAQMYLDTIRQGRT